MGEPSALGRGSRTGSFQVVAFDQEEEGCGRATIPRPWQPESPLKVRTA